MNEPLRVYVDRFDRESRGLYDTTEGFKQARAWAPDVECYRDGFTPEQKETVAEKTQRTVAAWEDAYTALREQVNDVERVRSADRTSPGVHGAAAEVGVPDHVLNQYCDAEERFLGMAGTIEGSFAVTPSVYVEEPALEKLMVSRFSPW